MNKTKLKAYAPKARNEFIQAVTERAHIFGVSAQEVEPITVQGDLVLIAGETYPKRVAEQRKKLEERIKQDGFQQVMESVAYTWFNRFVAIRYMEVHDFLDHGFRVLSHPEGKLHPQILEEAQHVNLPGITQQEIVEMKLDGNRDSELYRRLLLAQCNALYKVMPFLFEKINDETDLLLPDNLLHTDSLIHKLVNEVDDEDWLEVEIIGWLYQFYISEKKDEVIGKVVKTEDIPAATQLFTPNWIVKYMVQNSLGRTWLATYPNSSIRSKMEFYIEPSEQSEEVKQQLADITPNSLDPEKLTILDPACGSGHILVEAYDLLKEIYLERGYRTRDIPQLILEKNLFGLDIDQRAAQMAGFALLMKARTDNRQILQEDVLIHHNVLAIQNTRHLDPEVIIDAFYPDLSDLAIHNKEVNLLIQLINGFEQAETLGSLISIPPETVEALPTFQALLNQEQDQGHLHQHHAIEILKPLLQQATILAQKYDCVIANPPYMGSKGMNTDLKKFANDKYPESKSDIFAMFVERAMEMTNINGQLGFVMPYVWMFISSYEKFREKLETQLTLTSLIQLEYNAFEPACVPVATFTLWNKHHGQYKGDFIKLSDFKGHQNQEPKTLEALQNPDCDYRYTASSSDFNKISGSPIAYWISDRVREVFSNFQSLVDIAEPKVGLQTSDNDRFLRFWFEVNLSKLGFKFCSNEEANESGKKWFPCDKGGGFRKWYGNNEFVVNWENDGFEIKNFKNEKGKLLSRPQNVEHYFKEGVTWGKITSSEFSTRATELGFIFTDAGMKIPCDNLQQVLKLSGLLNSKLASHFLSAISQTLNFEQGNISRVPLATKEIELNSIKHAVNTANQDWDAFEISWDFQGFPLLYDEIKTPTLEQSFNNWQQQSQSNIAEMKRLEEENNQLFIEAYDLQDELTPEVPLNQITLTVNPKYRYGGDLSEEEGWTRFRKDTIKELISYAVGCMMGRYSLDQPGLIYAHSGNEGFDDSQYTTFRADDDGIVPITAMDWGFWDDVATRFVEFIEKAWSPEALEENLKFIAGNLSPKQEESPKETIRRYCSSNFFKDHLKRYKKRPIYWLFYSGKQKAFECLVYLHRYNEITLSRMRTEYVTPLQGKFSAREQYLRDEVDKTASTSSRKQHQKELDTLLKKQVELSQFDDLLRHQTDQRITLDLDDGVKVNYGKFGALLAEVKTVTGKK